ncbi:MAG: CapA family protein [Treponemataceae bacterium]
MSGFLLGAALGLCAILALSAVGDRTVRIDAIAGPPPAPTPVPIPAQEESMKSETSIETTLLAVGDMVFSRRIAERIQTDGWAGPFKNMGLFSTKADLVFGNLETTASILGDPFPGKPPVITFRASPGVLFGLKKAGFSVVSLANNHINDYGPLAIAETIDALDAIGIAHCGAGNNEQEAGRPAFVTSGGKRYAFLAYTENMWSIREAGTEAGATILNEDRVVADIREAKKNADFVLLSLHWGEELQERPRDSDQELAHRLVDAGADAILGHHPHVLQGAEIYKGKPILYSLGNFIFDMISKRTYLSAVAVLRFGAEGPRDVRFVPLRINDETFAPAPAEGEDTRDIGALFTERCAAVGGRLEALDDGSFRLRPPGAYRTIDKRADNSSSE